MVFFFFFYWPGLSNVNNEEKLLLYNMQLLNGPVPTFGNIELRSLKKKKGQRRLQHKKKIKLLSLRVSFFGMGKLYN